MSDAAIVFKITLVSAVIALLVTAAIAFFLARRLKGKLPAVLIAGFAIPIVIMVGAFYGVVTDDPDGLPPGMVLKGALAVAAIVAPFTLIVSAFAARFARR